MSARYLAARERLRSAIRRLGYDVVRYPGADDLSRRLRLLKTHGINLVLDVGANVGQYAHALRMLGYSGRIVSFEPVSEAYRELTKLADSDRDWIAVNVALGECNEERNIHVARNSQSSSLLDMLPAHIAAAPESRYVDSERVQLRTLDGLFGEYARPDDLIFLKIDTQGYEQQVLAGGAHSLARIAGVQLEMSLTPLYAGSMLIRDAIETMESAGLSLMSLEPGFCDPATGQLQQCDGVFFRRDGARSA